MSKSYDFPFGIEDVTEILGLFPKKKSPGSSYNVPCPFCGDKEWHLNVNKARDVWRCNRCGEHGGMLELYARAANCSSHEAYSAILKKLQNSSEQLQKPTNKISQVPKEQYRLEKDTDAVYASYLDKLWLKPVHKANLLKRGLTEEAIRANGYKTVPSIERFAVVRDLVDEGLDLSMIPGFYDGKNGEKAVTIPHVPGFYVPVRNIEGNITGMQIRTDYGKNKYPWFSSRYENGGKKVYVGPHFVGIDTVHAPKAIYLTEGPLKADVAHFLSGEPFMAIPGVSNTQTLIKGLKVLKKLGVKHIYDALDMDRFGNESCKRNENVYKSDIKLKKLIADFGFTCSDVTWDTGKGIDDFLLIIGGELCEDNRRVC